MMMANAEISPGVFPFIAIHAGIPKASIPSGIPCAKYKATKLKYRSNLFSESAGKMVFFLC